MNLMRAFHGNLHKNYVFEYKIEIPRKHQDPSNEQSKTSNEKINRLISFDSVGLLMLLHSRKKKIL